MSKRTKPNYVVVQSEAEAQAREILREYEIEYVEDSATILWLINEIEKAEERGANRERDRIRPLLQEALATEDC